MPSAPLYARLLGATWQDLTHALRRLHQAPGRARGRFRVVRGTSFAARALGKLCRLPGAGEDVPVELVARAEGSGERWTRRFGEHRLETLQFARGGLLVETLGAVLCFFRLRVDHGALVFEQVRSALGWRWLALPLPRLLAPSIEGRAEPEGDGVRVVVRISAPFAGLLLAYEGAVAPAEEDS